MNSLNVSMSMGAYFKLWVGGGLSLGENSFGVDVGFGIGGTQSATNLENLLYSISISYQEKRKTNLGGNWAVSQSGEVLSADGAVRGYKGQLIEFNLISLNPVAPAINATGITVSCGVTFNKNNKPIPNNQWRSDGYLKKEEEVMQ